jgi:hypothetical protein
VAAIIGTIKLEVVLNPGDRLHGIGAGVRVEGWRLEAARERGRGRGYGEMDQDLRVITAKRAVEGGEMWRGGIASIPGRKRRGNLR